MLRRGAALAVTIPLRYFASLLFKSGITHNPYIQLVAPSCLAEVLRRRELQSGGGYPYQFKPVLKFIDSPVDRLILADEVGLGKTIEAALIWLELRARRQAKRLLVICPKMLAEKWRRELREKFEIEAQTADFAALEDCVKLTETEGASFQCALVATYTGIKPGKRFAHQLDTENEETAMEFSPKAKLLRHLRKWSHSHAPFDLVIFDEAQAMRNPETAAFKLGESLAIHAGAVLCVVLSSRCAPPPTESSKTPTNPHILPQNQISLRMSKPTQTKCVYQERQGRAGQDAAD